MRGAEIPDIVHVIEIGVLRLISVSLVRQPTIQIRGSLGFRGRAPARAAGGSSRGCLPLPADASVATDPDTLTEIVKQWAQS